MKLSELVEAQRVISDVAMMLDHHGEHETADRLQAVAERLRAAGNGAAAVPELYALLAALRSVNAVAIERGDKFGVCDQIDNDGEPYQSQWLADILKYAAAPAANAQPAEPVAQAEQQPKFADFCNGDAAIHPNGESQWHAEPAQQPQEALPPLLGPTPMKEGRFGGKEVAFRMDAYYYGFAATGIKAIDLILSAVACAGKSFHQTEQWNEDCGEPYHDLQRGKTPVDWIQNAADDAAEAIRALSRAPVPEAGLTDEQISELWSWSMTADAERTATTQQHAFARAILAAAKGGKQ